MTTSPADPPTAAGIGAALRELAWTIHRHAPARAGAGPIPTTELALLKQIVDAPGSTVGELATVLGLQQPNASAGVGALERRGLVERRKDDADRRLSRVHATIAGVDEHRAISDAWVGPVERAVAALDPERYRNLVDALDALDAVDRQLRDG